MALVLAVAGPGAIVAAPSLAKAQAQDGRTLSPAEVRELRRQLGITLSQRDAAQSTATIERHRAAVVRADLHRVAQILGLPADTPPTIIAEQAERWAKQDQESREKLVQLLQIVSRIEAVGVRTAAQQFLQQAQIAFQEGRLEDADHAVAGLEFLRRSGLAGAGALWVNSVTLRASMAQQQSNFALAERLLIEAEQYEVGESRQRLFELRFVRAENAYAEGVSNRDSIALDRAIELYRNCRDLLDGTKDPEYFAFIQFNLANALYMRGIEDGGSAFLKEAARSYSAALQIFTRKHAPLMWARIQSNLGDVFFFLDEPESRTERLEEAVLAYEAALQEYTRDLYPLDWATTQSGLGNALSALSEREGGTERLEAAVRAYEASLQVYTREKSPLIWASTQNDLGMALSAIGHRESGTERLETAVQAFDAVLQEWTRERYPWGWADIQLKRAEDLKLLGERGEGMSRLRGMRQALRAAREVFVDAGDTGNAILVDSYLALIDGQK